MKGLITSLALRMILNKPRQISCWMCSWLSLLITWLMLRASQKQIKRRRRRRRKPKPWGDPPVNLQLTKRKNYQWVKMLVCRPFYFIILCSFREGLDFVSKITVWENGDIWRNPNGVFIFIRSVCYLRTDMVTLTWQFVITTIYNSLISNSPNVSIFSDSYIGDNV